MQCYRQRRLLGGWRVLWQRHQEALRTCKIVDTKRKRTGLRMWRRWITEVVLEERWPVT